MTDKIKRYHVGNDGNDYEHPEGRFMEVSDVAALLPSLNHALRIMQRCAQSKASGGPARTEIEQDMEQIRKLVEALK